MKVGGQVTNAKLGSLAVLPTEIGFHARHGFAVFFMDFSWNRQADILSY